MAFGDVFFTKSWPALLEDELVEEKLPAAFHVLSGKIHSDHLFYLTTMEGMLKLMGEPIENWLSYDFRDLQREADDRGYLFSAMMFRNIERVTHGEVHAMARLRITRILVAIKQYRAAEDDAPENLAALVPRFLDAVPLDPFSGNPFTFTREEGRLLVESEDRRIRMKIRD